MKRSIFLIGLMTLLGFVSQAQNDTMYVMKDGVVTHKISVQPTDVDSIIFYQPKKVEDANTVKDIEGNVYRTVTIGTQVWMAENLKTTKYSDGTAIPFVTDKSVWDDNYYNNTTKTMMCYYNNDITNKAVYGGLYNWYAVSSTTNGGKNVCPVGWHVPSDAEWTILTNYIGSNVGTKLKSKTGWLDNGNGTDDYNFSGVPGGYRNYYYGYFGLIGSDGYWWSSTSFDPNLAWTRHLYYPNSNVYRNSSNKGNGLSVRCIRD